MAVSQSLNVTLQSQSVVDNKSVVKIRWTSTQDGKSFNANTRTAYYYVSINGGAETRYSASYTLPQNSTKVIVDTTITVPHRADGTGQIKVRTWMDTKISAGVITRTRDLTLPTIARATTPTLSATSVTLGNSVTINLPRASSTFTHTVQYKVGSMAAYQIIKEGATTSTTFTPGLNIASALPNSTSGKCSIKVYTYDGTKFIGERIISNLNLNVPTNIVPTITQTLKPVNGLPLSSPTKYVQSKSSINVGVTGAGVYGSTIKSYSTTIKSGTTTLQTSSLSSFKSSVIGRSGAIDVVSTVTDSRGRTQSKTTKVTFQAYQNPLANNIKVFRSSSSGAVQDDGGYIRINATPVISSIGGSNTGTIIARYKAKAATSWTQATSKSGTGFGAIGVTIPASTETEYEVEIEVKDEFNKTKGIIYKYSVGSAFALIDFHKDGKGFAIGKVATASNIIDISDDFNIIGSYPNELDSSINLNDVRRTGNYLQRANADAITSKNYPTTKAGHLIVSAKESPRYGHILQEYHTYDNTEIWRRTLYDSKWNDWQKIWDKSNNLENFTSKITSISGVGNLYGYKVGNVCMVGCSFTPTADGITARVVTLPSGYHPLGRVSGQVDFSSSYDVRDSNVTCYITSNGFMDIVTRPKPANQVWLSFTYITS